MQINTNNNRTIDTAELKAKIVANKAAVTIAALLVELFRAYPDATNAEVAAVVEAEFPNSAYKHKPVQRAVTDRRKYNKGKFTYQYGELPEVPATDPEAKAKAVPQSPDAIRAEIARLQAQLEAAKTEEVDETTED